MDSGTLEELRESVRKLMAQRYSARDRRRLIDDELGFDAPTWRLISDQLGLTGLIVPEHYGGSGASWTAWQVAAEELGAALYSGPFLASAGLAVPALLSTGDERAKSRYLPGLANGSLIGTLATTEPGRDWAIDDITTHAAPGGSAGWILSGVKAYVVDAQAADVLFISALAPHGIGLFAVDRDADGCTLDVQPALDLTRRLFRVTLATTPAFLVSGDRDATQLLTEARHLSFVGITAEQVGVASAALQMAVDFAGIRHQFGRPIGQFQAVKHLCADMLVDLEAANSLANALARSADAGEDLTVPASMAKALCSDVAFSVAARMIQVHGGIGFTWEHDAHLFYRRAKSTELMFGDAAWQRRHISHILD